MTSIEYKGYKIFPNSTKMQNGTWRNNAIIHKLGKEKQVFSNNEFDNKSDADAFSIQFAKDIIDGLVNELDIIDL